MLKLGNTNIELSKIGLGCWQFSKNTGFAGSFWPSITNDNTRKIIQNSINGGINWFDTAELYGWGKSEQSLSIELKQLNIDLNKYFIATKWWPLFRTASSIKNTIQKVYLCS